MPKARQRENSRPEATRAALRATRPSRNATTLPMLEFPRTIFARDRATQGPHRRSARRRKGLWAHGACSSPWQAPPRARSWTRARPSRPCHHRGLLAAPKPLGDGQSQIEGVRCRRRGGYGFAAALISGPARLASSRSWAVLRLQHPFLASLDCNWQPGAP